MEQNKNQIEHRFPDSRIEAKLNDLEQKIDKVLDILAKIEKKVLND